MATFTYYKISTVDITTISAADSVSSDYPVSLSQSMQGSPRAITICNNDASGDACTVDLFINSESGADITDTGTNVNEIANYKTTNSVTLTVDGTSATDDLFKSEQVWKSDGTLFGTCTSVTNTTTLVFSGGISQDVLDNADLYTGTRYYILHDVVIPGGSTLLLEQPELNYDSTLYSLKFKLTSVSSSQIANIKVEY
tara:strand:- start:354 stop:947 length:594 start_codon:yes stop_codon:yes gene_type:complete